MVTKHLAESLVPPEFVLPRFGKCHCFDSAIYKIDATSWLVKQFERLVKYLREVLQCSLGPSYSPLSLTTFLKKLTFPASEACFWEHSDSTNHEVIHVTIQMCEINLQTKLAAGAQICKSRYCKCKKKLKEIFYDHVPQDWLKPVYHHWVDFRKSILFTSSWKLFWEF